MQQRFLSLIRLLVITGWFGTAFQARADVLIDFDSNPDYDTNFVERTNGSYLFRDASGYLRRTGTVDNATTSVIYNNNATGGSGGSGGTTINTPYNVFSVTTPLTLQADYSLQTVGNNNADSFGFWVGVSQSATPTTGYCAIFRIYSTYADFRLYDSNSNPNTGVVGTQLGSTLTSNGVFSANTAYTLKLTTEQVGGNVQFTASIWTNQGTALMTTFASIADSTSPLTSGQVGFRFGRNSDTEAYLDNFAVIPEPSTWLLVVAGLAGMLVLKRQPR